jgi:hypothetical protein
MITCEQCGEQVGVKLEAAFGKHCTVLAFYSDHCKEPKVIDDWHMIELR